MGNEDSMEVEHTGMEYKCVGVAGFKSLDEEGEGIVESIVSVTGVVDNVRDVIAPGAYTKSLNTRTPKGVWHHDWKESVSKTLDIKELMPGDPDLPDHLPNGDPWPEGAGALKVKTQFNLGTQRGREAYSDVTFFGDQQEWSIGYNVPVGGASRNTKSGVRTINKLELYEYSPVLFGAMPAARTASVKDAQLAYKSLMQAEATNDDVDDLEEKSIEIYGDDGSEREYGFMEDGIFTKAQITVSSGQARKIHRAIASLLDILRDTNVVSDEEFEGLTGGDMGGDMSGQENEEEDMGGEDEGGEPEERPMSEVIAEVFEDDDEASSLAEDFDTAFDDEDPEALEAAVTALLDYIEQNSDGDTSEYEAVGNKIRTALEAASEWTGDEGEDEEDDSEDSEDDFEEDDEEKSYEDDADLEYKTISLEEINRILG